MIFRITLALLLGALAGCSPTLTRFESTLASRDSATQALGEWCATRGLADPPVVRALADRSAHEAPPPSVRSALGVDATERVAFRHVRLACGETVLSDAKNWYVPARLAEDMNRTLETTDVPFGKVVSSLGFHRERLASRRGRAAECPAGTVLSHTAVLRLADGRAISLVVECYTRANIGG